MGDILGKVPFYANGRQRKKEDSDERNDNTFVFFAGRLWKAAAPLFDKEKELTDTIGVNDRERTSDVADGDREPADCCFDR